MRSPQRNVSIVRFIIEYIYYQALHIVCTAGRNDDGRRSSHICLQAK